MAEDLAELALEGSVSSKFQLLYTPSLLSVLQFATDPAIALLPMLYSNMRSTELTWIASCQPSHQQLRQSHRSRLVQSKDAPTKVQAPRRRPR